MSVHVGVSTLVKSVATVALWFPAIAGAQGNPRLTVTGKVIDSAGKPLSNSTVMVYHAGVKHGYSTFCPSCYEDCGKRTTTDADGIYTLKRLSSDLWFELLVVRDGFAPTFTKVEANSSNAVAAAVVLNARTLTIDPTKTVKGKVVDGEGNPVRDAVVKSEGVEIDKGAIIGTIPGLDPLAVTNDDGNFELVYTNPAKRMLLLVEARNLAPNFAVLATGADRKTVVLSKGATIRGRLMADGQPVGGAEVGLIGQTPGGFGPRLTIVGTPYSEMHVGTQEDGSFIISDVPTPIEWYVYAKMESVASRGSTEPKACATTRPEEIVNVGDIQLRRGYSIEGVVVLSDGKAIFDGMRVIVASQQVRDNQTALLDKNGHFRFLSLPAGKYSISPAVRGYSLPEGKYAVEFSVEQNVKKFVISLNPNPVAH